MSFNLFRMVYRTKVQPFEGIPGPAPWFPVGNLLDFVFKQKRPWEVVAEYGHRYGRMSIFWIFSEPAIVLNDASLIAEVMISRTEDFYKDEPCGALIPVLTRSSPNINNGEEWKRTRWQSPLTQTWIGEWRSRQLPAVRQVLRTWANQMCNKTTTEPVPMLVPTKRLSFDCFSVATLGRLLPDSVYDQFMELASMGSQRMLTPRRPSPELSLRGQETRQRFLGSLREAYDSVAAHPDPSAFDLLSMALAHGTPLPPQELSAEMGNVFYGGCFSVPSTLVSTLHLLSHHPAEMEKVTTAVQKLDDDCDQDALGKCQPLDYALREGMRLLPAVPMFSRRVLASKATQLGGHLLPANTAVWMSSWLLQRSAPQWDRPLEFRPDRWANGVAEANPLGSDYFFPEGRGPRICLGADFSIFFMKLFLATLLKNWDIDCGRGQTYDAGQDFFFGVRMPFGLRATIRRK